MNEIVIPSIDIKDLLIHRYIICGLGGFDSQLDKESRLFLIFLCRLIDNSIKEYNLVKELIEEEIKTKDKLNYMFDITTHLESVISSTHRACKIIKTLQNGLFKNKIFSWFPFKKKIKEDYFLLNNIDENLINEILIENKLSKIRNRIEHVYEDIYLKKFEKDFLIKIDEKYEKISINKKEIKLLELVSLINLCHKIVTEIFNNLPNKWNKEKGYYSDIKK